MGMENTSGSHPVQTGLFSLTKLVSSFPPEYQRSMRSGAGDPGALSWAPMTADNEGARQTCSIL